MKLNRVVVTGASSGIGKEMALELAARGTNLVLTARRTELLEDLARELRARGLKVDVLGLDLSRASAPQELYDFCLRSGEVVDGLINNAGLGPYRAFLKSSLPEHHQVMQLNMLRLTELSHLFGQHMLAHGRRSVILNVASVAAYQAVPKFAVYSASKFYVRIFSELLGHELRGTNISVTCLCPGGTATEFLEKNNQKLKGSFSPLMSARAVARAGIDGALRGKAVIVPGVFNKLSCWLPRFLPSSWSIGLADWGMRLAVTERDS